ncbi:hypothetical protein BD311DRAFT_614495, partial [Dichomitus squalens]
EPFILVALLVVSALHTLSSLDRKATNLVLETARVFLTGAFIWCNKSLPKHHPATTGGGARKHAKLTPPQQAIVDSIPRDIRTVLSQLRVQPDIVRYACC